MVLACGLAFAGQGQSAGQAGVFDFYLLTLSWTPEFCHTHQSNPECSGHHGFMVHGLWPQNKDGSWPQDCQTSQPGPSDTSPVADIMPSDIIDHEWQKHGTCSGLSGDDYFKLIRSVFDSITIPQDLKSPSQAFTTRPARLKDDFEKANSSLSDQAMAIQLTGGYLNAVEICLSKGDNPQPIACSGLRDVHGGTFKVAPVR
jgi:ribonuclease T2